MKRLIVKQFQDHFGSGKKHRLIYGIPMFGIHMCEEGVHGKRMKFAPLTRHWVPIAIFVNDRWECFEGESEGASIDPKWIMKFRSEDEMHSFYNANMDFINFSDTEKQFYKTFKDKLFASACHSGHKIPSDKMGLYTKDANGKERFFLVDKEEYYRWYGQPWFAGMFRVPFEIDVTRHEEVPRYFDEP